MNICFYLQKLLFNKIKNEDSIKSDCCESENTILFNKNPVYADSIPLGERFVIVNVNNSNNHDFDDCDEIQNKEFNLFCKLNLHNNLFLNYIKKIFNK